MTINKLKWERFTKVVGTRHLRAYRSACGRFEIVAVMGGPWGSTWDAYDLPAGANKGGLYGTLAQAKAWCAART
jgi:hypothetical protein